MSCLSKNGLLFSHQLEEYLAMEIFVYVLILLVLNIISSWGCAWSVGLCWVDTKVIGRLPRFTIWCLTILSVAGFFWCQIIIYAIITGIFLEPQHIMATVKLSVFISALLFFGSVFGILFNSTKKYWLRRSGINIETFVQAHKAYKATSLLPELFNDINSIIKSDDKEAKTVLLICVIIFSTLLAGILTPTAIINFSAKSYAKQVASKTQTTSWTQDNNSI